MKCKRLNEVIELLQPARRKSLIQFGRNFAETGEKSQVLTANWKI